MKQDQLSELIDELVHDFQKESVQLIKKNIVKENLTVSNELLKSIDVKVEKNTQQFRYEISLLTTDYAKTVDSRLKTIRLASVESLIDWVKRKGLQHFQFTPNYKKVPKIDTAARRIAYGLIHGKNSRGKYKTNQKKRKVIMSPYLKEWNKTRSEIVNIFVKQSTDMIMDDLVSTLKGKLYQ